MLESGISNIMMFFVIVGVAVIFIVIWIIKSESRVTVARDQIKALRLRLEAGERERYMLSEKLSSVDSAPRAAQETVVLKEESQSKDKGVSKKKLEEALKAKEALETRKTVERAKGVLMKMNNLTEDAAYKLIHRKSMDSCKPMKDIAESILLMADFQKGM